MQEIQSYAGCFCALLRKQGMNESLFILISAVFGGIVFCILVVLSTMRKNKVWRALAYTVSLIPAVIQARNHGFGLEVFLAACFFLALTWVILHFARKEIGEDMGQ
jgi:phosphotransferase system  glucose/maltose/N-acetylglucosamine-specific IIC component